MLAVAVAGAGVIAWYGIQPTTLPNDPTVTAGMVEDKVTEEVRKLEDARKQTGADSEAKLTSALHDYVADWRGPRSSIRWRRTWWRRRTCRGSGRCRCRWAVQQPGAKVFRTRERRLWRVKVPREELAVMADRGSVLPPSTDPSQPQPAPGPGAMQPVDKNCGVGGHSVGGLCGHYFKACRRPRSCRTKTSTTCCKVESERRARTATGWTTWAPVPATSGGRKADSEIGLGYMNHWTGLRWCRSWMRSRVRIA